MLNLPSIERIESKSLRERVLDRLRSAIISGDLKPGQSLVSTELASQLGVSHATLREAIQALSVEGLVESVAYHVPIVKKVSRKDIQDLFNVRTMLEAFAIRQIISSNNVELAANELYRICEAMKAAADNDSLEQVNWVDRDFHEALILHSNNDLLGTIWNSVSVRVQQAMSLCNQRKGDLKQIAMNHLAIAEAIGNEDETESIRLINEHLGKAGVALLAIWDLDDAD